MSNHTDDEEKLPEIKKIEDVSEKLSLSEEIVTKETIENIYEEEEDTDIQIVNELSTMQDDPTLPCFTLRVFVAGIVCIKCSYKVSHF